MIDDQGRYEWVNVSSGTGSPGSPGPNPESCKTSSSSSSSSSDCLQAGIPPRYVTKAN